MVEPATLLAALAALGVWLDRLTREHAKVTDARRNAVTTLLSALAATKSHLHDDTGIGHEAAREKEHELARLWSAAAAAFYNVDPESSALMMLKSDAWSRPSAWPDDRVKAAGISIEDVEQKAATLLRRWA